MLKKTSCGVFEPSVFIVLLTFLPTDLYAINRLFAQVHSELKSYRYFNYWFSATNHSDAVNTVKILNKMIYSYTEVSQYIPEDKCVYTIHQEQFMYYARRLAFPLPLPEEVMGNKIAQHLGECEYIHVLHTNSHQSYPGGYPINRLENNFNYLMLTRMSEDMDSPVVGALLQLH